MGVNLTLLDLSPENLAIALRGTASEDVSAATVTDEAHTAYAGALIPLDFLPDTSQTVTVVINPGATPTSTTQDTDWTLTRAGITIIEGGAITDGSTIGVSYTKALQSMVEAMTESATEFELIFDGLNEAQSGKAVTVRVHRLKFSPAQGLNLIGDEFAELALEGTALIDTSITGSNLSKYFKIATEN